MPRLAIIDPLTLVGREISDLLCPSLSEDDVVLVHTSSDQEHQIASLASTARLVPPLVERDQIADCPVLVLAAEEPGSALRVLEEVLDAAPEILFVDASSTRLYRDQTTPALEPSDAARDNRLRVPHPAVVMAAAVTRALSEFEPKALAITALEPASVFGAGAIPQLARQAAQRLQGEDVTELVADRLLAFNHCVLDAAILTAEAAQILPDIDVSAVLAASGWFHGHVAGLGFTFDRPIDPHRAAAAIDGAQGLHVSPAPISLDGLPGRSDILVSPPIVSTGGRSLSLQALADGTRIGGAFTVAALIENSL